MDGVELNLAGDEPIPLLSEFIDDPPFEDGVLNVRPTYGTRFPLNATECC